jgi:hypothetical protein
MSHYRYLDILSPRKGVICLMQTSPGSYKGRRSSASIDLRMTGDHLYAVHIRVGCIVPRSGLPLGGCASCSCTCPAVTVCKVMSRLAAVVITGSVMAVRLASPYTAWGGHWLYVTLSLP